MVSYIILLYVRDIIISVVLELPELHYASNICVSLYWSSLDFQLHLDHIATGNTMGRIKNGQIAGLQPTS